MKATSPVDRENAPGHVESPIQLPVGTSSRFKIRIFVPRLSEGGGTPLSAQRERARLQTTCRNPLIRYESSHIARQEVNQ